MTEAAYYPVFLDLRSRTCVVLGDTPTADDKVTGLEGAGAVVVHHRRGFRTGDLVGAHLAIDASGDPVSEAAARCEADRERVMLNVVDVASRCDWIAPAVVRRGPLQVAVSTSGESPFLASALRERLEAMLGDEWGPLTTAMGALRRRLRLHGVPVSRQRRAYRRLMQSDALALLAAGRVDAAGVVAASIEAEARGPARDPAVGEVVLVGAGPGDPGLLTVAGREALMSADVVFHDSLAAGVLTVCPASARLVDVGKRAGGPSTPQDEITAALVAAARSGRSVVRLKGGDPYVFGRGGEEVLALRAAGVPVRVIPGLSSAFAAPSAAGIPLTHRGVAASIAVVTGQRVDGAEGSLERLAASADTLVVLMPGDLDSLTARLIACLGSGRPAALVSAATTAHQKVVRAPLGLLAAAAASAGVRSPATLVTGAMVDLLAERSVPIP